jgi:hypothetical protein
MYYFIYCVLSFVLVDIVPVWTEEPVKVDQEHFFEEEQYQFLGKEGKWYSPPAYSILSYIIVWQLILPFIILHKFDGEYFLRTWLDFIHDSLEQPCLNKCFG